MIGVLSAFTFASAVTVSAQPTTVSAAGGLDVNSAINNYITIGDSSLHYSFNGGNNFDVIMTGSKISCRMSVSTVQLVLLPL